jgi:quercetin dioxygenase-like cupin family protein
VIRPASFLAVAIFGLAPPALGAQLAETRLGALEITALAKGGAGAGSSGVAGIQTAVLAGDPTKAGPYTIEIRVPAHTRIAAHTHRDDRSAVVVSGTWWFGYGSASDEAKAKPLAPGSFYTEPGGDPHFALTKDEPVVVYITGSGPTDTRYINPAVDPRRSGKAAKTP